MKHLTLTWLLLVCLFGLGACSTPGATDDPEEPKTTEVQQETPKQERVQRDFFDRK